MSHKIYPRFLSTLWNLFFITEQSCESKPDKVLVSLLIILLHANFFYFSGNIFISFNTDVDECHNSGDEGFDENETPGPRKRMPLYKIGTLEFHKLGN